MAAYTYDRESRRRVRLLINDVGGDPEGFLFREVEIDRFLGIEDGDVKLAAAQAIDTIADNEALVSKVLKTQDLATDGAKLAAELRKRAAALREQAESAGATFDIVDVLDGGSTAELLDHQTAWPF